MTLGISRTGSSMLVVSTRRTVYEEDLRIAFSTRYELATCARGKCRLRPYEGLKEMHVFRNTSAGASHLRTMHDVICVDEI